MIQDYVNKALEGYSGAGMERPPTKAQLTKSVRHIIKQHGMHAKHPSLPALLSSVQHHITHGGAHYGSFRVDVGGSAYSDMVRRYGSWGDPDTTVTEATDWEGSGIPAEIRARQKAELEAAREEADNDPANDDWHEQREENAKMQKQFRLLNPEYNDPNWFNKKSEGEKGRYWRQLHKRQEEYAAETNARIAQEEAERDAEEDAQRAAEEARNPWNVALSALNEGISNIPVVGQFAKTGAELLENHLKGHGKPKRSRAARGRCRAPR